MIRSLIVALAVTGVAIPAAAQETRASAAAKFHKEFAASDANHDGVLSRAEVKARIGRMGAAGQSIDPVHAERLAGLWFTRADANKDGKVSEAEAQALLSATFAKYDANKDGKVGGEERAAAKRGATR